MVPAQWVLLEQMPLSPNGKLDRKALPKPETAQHYEAPQSALEQQIAAIWADVLGIEHVGLNDNFFERGGDSIISIQVVSRARAAGIHFTANRVRAELCRCNEVTPRVKAMPLDRCPGAFFYAGYSAQGLFSGQ